MKNGWILSRGEKRDRCVMLVRFSQVEHLFTTWEYFLDSIHSMIHSFLMYVPILSVYWLFKFAFLDWCMNFILSLFLMKTNIFIIYLTNLQKQNKAVLCTVLLLTCLNWVEKRFRKIYYIHKKTAVSHRVMQHNVEKQGPF